MRLMTSIVALSIAVLGAVPAALAPRAMAQGSPPPPAPPPTGQAVAKIREDAAAMRDFVTSPLARSFLEASRLLPEVTPVNILIDRASRKYYTPDQAKAVAEPDRAKLQTRSLDESFYYNTKYGSPLAYARALDLLATADHPRALHTLAERRIVDFGYGNIGQLRLMAAQFADAVGVDVDPLLQTYYGQFDQRYFTVGVPAPQMLESCSVPSPGSIRLVNGQWPADPGTAQKVGTGYDLFISKNTLKRGYVHPEREADPRTLINLGVTDDLFLARLFEILNPGGWAMIYNICPAPAPADKPYIPWADGRCPFEESALKSAGFEVLAFDHDDTEAARKMAHILGWDQGEGAMNLKDDLFAWYTILRKPE